MLEKSADHTLLFAGRIPLQPLRAATNSVREWLKALDMGGFADAFEKVRVLSC